MEVFRISIEKYSNQLISSGKANRWNFDGEFVFYTASSRSLSTLELIVHRSSVVPAENFKVMVISIADDDHLYKQIKLSELPQSWRSLAAYSKLQSVGSEWIQTGESLVLKVPSAVIPQEYNFVINTRHPEFHKKVQLIRAEPYFWDQRLFKR